MRRRGFSNKPCPGCKKPGPTPTDDVCGDCRKLLADARAVMDALEGRKQADDLGSIVVPHVKSHHWWAGFYQGERHQPGIRETLRKAVAVLAWECSEPAGREFGFSHILDDEWLTPKGYSQYGPPGIQNSMERSGWQSCDQPRLMRKPVIQAFRDLYGAIAAALTDATDAGRTRGQNILLELASGEMSVQDFNERTR